MCISGIDVASLRFFDWSLELYRHCDIFFFFILFDHQKFQHTGNTCTVTKYKFSDYQGGRIINFILHNDNCIRELSFLDAIDCIDLINKSHINQHVTISFQWCCLKCYIRHITMLIFPLLPIYYGLNIFYFILLEGLVRQDKLKIVLIVSTLA